MSTEGFPDPKKNNEKKPSQPKQIIKIGGLIIEIPEGGVPFGDGFDEFFASIINRMSRVEYEETKSELALEKSPEGYYFFTHKDERQHLFECFKKMGEFIHKNKIANLVFVDRAARGGYMGVKQYLRSVYPKDSQPGIYFVNPRGFNLQNFDKSPASLKTSLFITDNKRYKKIDERFAEVYKKLCEDKDKPVMVFDACIHTGSTITPILDSFSRQGFNNVKVGLYNNDVSFFRETHKQKIDLIMNDNKFSNSCSPFNTESILERNMDVVSEVSHDVNPRLYKRLAQLRNEMAQIVIDGLKAEKK